MSRVYLPADSAARSVGADQVADLLQAQGVEVVRTGTRGMCWLEPLLEVDTAQGRVGYGPVRAADVPNLLEAGCLMGAAEHPLYLGPVEELPWMQGQQRLIYARTGLADPLDLDAYLAQGGFQGLDQAQSRTGQEIVDLVRDSGLRGRGGAAFPAGIKWQTVRDAAAQQKYIVCNADEGDSGTFADRMLMEGDPYCLIEGMCIAGLGVGATHGYIYLREEYRDAYAVLTEAIARAADAGYLGAAFQLEVRLGAGSYVCGEETALLESLEGKRGMVRAKPPLPALVGFLGQPTLVHNVITLASVPAILVHGADHYHQYGVARSRGTMPFQLAGNLKHTGLLELPFGRTLRELLYDFGGGSRSGRPLRAVQVGGPLGAYLPETQWDTPLDYEAFAELGGVLGHGGIVAFDDSVDMLAQARFAMEFCAVESCGKCTPCRVGAVRGVEVIDRIHAGERRVEHLELLHDLCDTMEAGSLCAMGGMTPYPVRSAVTHFAEDFDT